ncbi:ead/Ea22-like family protein [Salmonella enterica]|nr:ead/Ea22-like family protein [Salmonella enterica]EEP9460286.1 ead/Ea22-like family protein [Salmonella enterica]
MKCGDLSHEYLLFAKEPKNVLALLDEWEADKEQIKALESRNRRLDGIIDAAEKRVAELESIATDYGVKFQKAQDALKHQALLHKSQIEAAEKRIAELEAKLETADKLQDSAFRDGLKAGFSYGQTDDQSGYEQCLKSYSSRGKDNG